MNNQQIQKKDQAGNTKLTLVSIYFNGRNRAAFMPLRHDIEGRAILPVAAMDKMLDDARVMRGQTFTVG